MDARLRKIEILVSVLVALDDSASTVVLFVIENTGSVILFVSSPADAEGAGAIVVVSTIVDGSGTVFSIIVIHEGNGDVVIAITVTVFSWCPIIVIVLDLGTSAVILSSILVLVNIAKIETIVLYNGANVFVVFDDDEGAVAIESNNSAFIWDRGRINNLVYWWMDGDQALKMQYPSTVIFLWLFSEVLSWK